MGLVRVGTVVRAVGLKGHLGVGGSDGGLEVVDEVVLRRGAEERRAAVREARPQGRVWALRVDGVGDRTAAERWIGAEVWVEREALGEAGEGRHYWADLEGLPVVTVGGAEVGRVTGLLETGGVDVLVVTGGGREVLIPLAPYVEVDRAGGRVVVDPPDGLLDGT